MSNNPNVSKFNAVNPNANAINDVFNQYNSNPNNFNHNQKSKDQLNSKYSNDFFTIKRNEMYKAELRPNTNVQSLINNKNTNMEYHLTSNAQSNANTNNMDSINELCKLMNLQSLNHF